MSGTNALSSPLAPAQVLSAAKALLAYVAKRNDAKEPKPLFQDDETVHVLLTLCKIPDELSKTPLPIPLVHELNPSPKICVFARGTGKDAKVLLERLGVSVKVIGIKKMEKKYQPFEMRRKLAGSYDLFLCDQTISKPLIPLCGKIFFQRHKMPLAIALDDGAAAAIETAKRATTMAQSKGVCWAIKVGRTGQSATQLAENAINAANFAIARHVAGGWTNIQSVNLKTDSSVALPVYAKAPRPGLVVPGATVPVVPSKRVDREQPVEDEDDAELRELAKEADIDWFSSDDDDGEQDAAGGGDDDDDDDNEGELEALAAEEENGEVAALVDDGVDDEVEAVAPTKASKQSRKQQAPRAVAAPAAVAPAAGKKKQQPQQQQQKQADGAKRGKRAATVPVEEVAPAPVDKKAKRSKQIAESEIEPKGNGKQGGKGQQQQKQGAKTGDNANQSSAKKGKQGTKRAAVAPASATARDAALATARDPQQRPGKVKLQRTKH